jgi:predicted metal-dependent phosphoesterase TrpH
MHSTASDGVYSPEEVVQIALANQVDVIALTDHDTIGGVAAALRAAEGKPIEIIPGIEISSKDQHEDRDMLVYLYDLNSKPLLDALAAVRDDRIHRAEKMLNRLAELGMPIPLEDVMKQATKGTIARPHIAQAMMLHGYASSYQEAFDKYLNDDGPAYIPHLRIEPTEAIRLAHDAGGVVVLAHPGRYGDYHPIIDELAPLGLDGIEVYYPDHTPEMIADLRQIAKRYDLLQTVGSDFHRRDGHGSASIGSVRTPTELDVVGTLKARAARYRPPTA